MRPYQRSGCDREPHGFVAMRQSARRDIAISLMLFAVAFVLRLPACYESLWLDELHTAWTVDGSLGEVAYRAIAGNQSPVYYWALWFYGTIASPLLPEISLRLPAVIATSLGAAIAYFSLRKAGVGQACAITSGLCFAIQSHSLFFGTEARVFGAVILLSCLACHGFVTDQHFWFIFACSSLAVAIQPVSAPLFAMVLIAAWFHQRLRCNLWQGKHCLVMGLMAILAIAASWKTLSQAWTHRQQWASFGSAHSVSQVATAFPWIALVIVPLGGLVAADLLARLRMRAAESNGVEGQSSFSNSLQPLPIWRRSAELAGISFATVLLYWLVAYFRVAPNLSSPLLHRRAAAVVLVLRCDDRTGKKSFSDSMRDDEGEEDSRSTDWMVRHVDRRSAAAMDRNSRICGEQAL